MFIPLPCLHSTKILRSATQSSINVSVLADLHYLPPPSSSVFIFLIDILFYYSFHCGVNNF